jgi:LPS export ABC transporter protein LptC
VTRIGFVVLAIVFSVAGCRRVAQEGVTPSQTLEDFTLNQNSRGAPNWRLHAQSAILHEQTQQAGLTRPAMEFYEKGKAVSRVTGLAGQVHLETHDVHLSSSVVLEVLDEHTTLYTDYLDYSSKSQLFTTKADVLIVKPEGRLRGQGMEATPDLSQIRIFHQKSVVEGSGK